MKTFIKTCWSVWDKTDKIVTIASIIGILLICCTICSCNAQPNHNDIPVMEYYDASGEDFDNNYIPIYADGVVDFIYCTQDEEYIIEYMDDDAFDPDNIPQTVSCTQNSEPVVQIYCSEELFFEYLNWYNSLTNKDSLFFEPSDKFFIKLAHCGNPTDGYDYYKLITN